MAQFRDNNGRTWEVTVTTATLKRVKSLLHGVDLGKMASNGTIYSALADDPILLCDLLYAVCKPEADAAGVSDEDFGRGMAGDAIDDATTALMEGLIDFFPKGRRNLYRKALTKQHVLTEKAIAMIERRIESDELDNELKRELSSSATSSAESPGSTPTP